MAQTLLVTLRQYYMAISIPFCIAGISALQRFYLRTSRQLRYLDLEEKSPIYSNFLETLEGLSTIRAFGWQLQSRKIGIDRLDKSQIPSYLICCIQRWLNLTLDLVIGVLGVGVITLAVKFKDTTNGGLIGVALVNILGLNRTLSRLVEAYTQLETSIGAVARIKNLEESTPSEDRPCENFIPPEDWPARGSIQFSNVIAAYGLVKEAFYFERWNQ